MVGCRPMFARPLADVLLLLVLLLVRYCRRRLP